MREFFDHLWDAWNLSDDWQHFAVWALAITSTIVIAYILGWLIRVVIGTFIARIASKTETEWDDHLFEHKFFARLGNFLPSIVAYFLLSALVTPDDVVFPVVKKLVLLWIVVSGTAFTEQFITNVQKGYLKIIGDKRVPIRSYVQVLKIFLFLVSGILVFAILLDQNPLGILTGLGALTAVLLLVFRDALLGLVASLQLNSNDLVHMGDWIELPGTNIDGEVIDIALSVVKIRSSDNTVSSMPTYNLVSQPFKNWRNVNEVGARRLKISFPVDSMSLVRLTDEQRQRLTAAGYWKVPEGWQDVTNLEAYRFWAQNYLENETDVHPDLVRLVKFGDPAGRGLPVEMIFYTRLTGYPAFEHLRSHLICVYLAALGTFELRVFQDAVGSHH